MRSGGLRTRVTVQTKVEVQTSSGELDFEWEDLRTVWAEVAPSRGNQYFAAKQVQSAQSVLVRVRYAIGYRTGQRLKLLVEDLPMYLDVVDVVDPDLKHKYLELMCKMREADGSMNRKQ